MNDKPDTARLASLIGAPARAHMLAALLDGKALTARELASVAGIGPASAAAHLAKLTAAGLLRQRRQGRHRYYSLADDDVAGLLRASTGLAAGRGYTRPRTGPKEPALRKARACYNHLAGEYGVRLFDSLAARGFLAESAAGLDLTAPGRAFAADFGIDLGALAASRRPLCKTCLDWSARRSHLAGALGTALLDRFQALGWAERRPGSRAVTFSKQGEGRFLASFPI